uniref:Uncharacterized protein n=1 Tax=Setaria italica TaxID=4555 RepID=K3ZPF5_SETIT
MDGKTSIRFKGDDALEEGKPAPWTEELMRAARQMGGGAGGQSACTEGWASAA